MSSIIEETVRIDPGKDVRGSLVVVVALATALIMALGVVLAWQIQRYGTRTLRTPHAARFGSPPSDVSGIEMTLLTPGGPDARQRDRGRAGGGRAEHDVPRAGAEGSAGAGRTLSSVEAEQRLRSYGWNDRAGGSVHIPIARAMQLYEQREKADRARPAPHPEGRR